MEKLAHNYHALRGLTPYGTKFMGLVKADAYGAVPMAKKLEELGADYLGVASLDEAIELREAGLKLPILILGCTPALYAGELVQYNITQACYDLEYAKALSAQVQKGGGELYPHPVRHRDDPSGLPVPGGLPGPQRPGNPRGGEAPRPKGRGHLHPLCPE